MAATIKRSVSLTVRVGARQVTVHAEGESTDGFDEGTLQWMVTQIANGTLCAYDCTLCSGDGDPDS